MVLYINHLPVLFKLLLRVHLSHVVGGTTSQTRTRWASGNLSPIAAKRAVSTIPVFFKQLQLKQEDWLSQDGQNRFIYFTSGL